MLCKYFYHCRIKNGEKLLKFEIRHDHSIDDKKASTNEIEITLASTDNVPPGLKMNFWMAVHKNIGQRIWFGQRRSWFCCGFLGTLATASLVFRNMNICVIWRSLKNLPKRNFTVYDAYRNKLFLIFFLRTTSVKATDHSPRPGWRTLL